MPDLLEAGKIINTHGVRGELRVEPWADSADFLTDFDVFYIDGTAFEVESSRVHKEKLLLKLAGVDSIEAAEKLKNRVVYIDREDAELDEGQYFLSDLIGCEAVTEEGVSIGKVTDVLSRPGGDILEIRGESEHLVPIVPFVLGHGSGVVTVRLIEGM